MPEIDENRERLQKLVYDVMDSVCDRLDTETVKLVTEFIENYEFGVALEWMYSVTHKHDRPLSEEQYSKLRGLAVELEVDLPS